MNRIELTEQETTTLVEAAKSVVKNSYSPYSHYAVGAAVLTNSGKIFTGVNIENASYGLTICAERVAIGNTVSNGYQDIKAIAVYSPNGNASPCGACRQFIREFGGNIQVIVLTQDGNIMKQSISDLLPNSFNKNELI